MPRQLVYTIAAPLARLQCRGGESIVQISDAVLDTSVRIETPEHVDFAYNLAGPWQRMFAYLLDLIIRFCFMFALFVFVAAAVALTRSVEDLAQAHIALLLLGWFALEWFYHVLFEWLWDGRTPGKRAFHLRVVKTGGFPIGMGDALLRNLLRGADLLPAATMNGFFPSYLTGMLVSASDPMFRRLGDMVADTMVIVEPRMWLRRGSSLKPPATQEELAELPPRPRLTVEERKVIEALVQRFGDIGPARRREICSDFAIMLAQRFALPAPSDPARFLLLLHARGLQTATALGERTSKAVPA